MTNAGSRKTPGLRRFEELRAAIINLMDNAVKYSATEKRVDVSIKRKDDKEHLHFR